MPQINAELYAQNHADKAAAPWLVKAMVAWLTGFVVLSGAYFVMTKVFYAQGVISIIFELVGGSVFLYVILRKGRL